MKDSSKNLIFQPILWQPQIEPPISGLSAPLSHWLKNLFRGALKYGDAMATDVALSA